MKSSRPTFYTMKVASRSGRQSQRVSFDCMACEPATRYKAAGGQAFAQGQYNEALSLFNEAVRLCTQDQLPALHSNRSACLLQLAQPQAALSAALLVTALRPAWPKGHLRRALALSALKRFQEASTAVAQGLQLAPGDADLLEMQQTLAELQPGVRAGSSAVDAQQSHAGRPIKLPVTILSGFLGAGKSTLLKRILHNTLAQKVAVIVNDMAEINIDSQLVSQGSSHSEGIVELTNGCICCTLRDDLVQEVAQKAAEGTFDLLVIESTGKLLPRISEPMPVAAAFHLREEGQPSLADLTEIDIMVTVVDASTFGATMASSATLQDSGQAASAQDRRSLAGLLTDQVEFADVILLNKADLVGPEQAATTQALLQRLNPAAHVLPCQHCNVPLTEVLCTGRFSLERAASAAGWQQELAGVGAHTPESEQLGITSFVYRAGRPFHPERLWQAVAEGSALPPVLRSKGFFWVAARPLLVWQWSTAGCSKCFEPYGLYNPCVGVAEGERQQQLVFIGQQLPQDKIVSVLDSCLLSDQEASAGQGHWLSMKCPWDLLL